MKQEKLNLHEIDSMLNKHSGLHGMAGVSDMRDIEKAIAEGDKLAVWPTTCTNTGSGSTSERMWLPWTAWTS